MQLKGTIVGIKQRELFYEFVPECKKIYISKI